MSKRQKSATERPKTIAGTMDVSRKRTRGARRTRAELEELLLQAACSLFADRGFQSVTTRDITNEAGVALPVLYRLFRDKRALYVECYMRLQLRGIRRIEVQVAHFDEPLEIIYAFTITVCETSMDFPAIRLFHRVLLDREMVLLSRVAKVFFSSIAMKQVVASVASLESKHQAYAKLLSLHSLISGVIEHAPFYNLAPNHRWIDNDPHSMALYALRATFPAVDSWGKVASRVQAKLDKH
jgi:AcrR family transcriptional regulator